MCFKILKNTLNNAFLRNILVKNALLTLFLSLLKTLKIVLKIAILMSFSLKQSFLRVFLTLKYLPI
jgi:hypothetical protein